jgi:protease-4
MRLHEILATEELAIHEPALGNILARLTPFFARLTRNEEAGVEGALAREENLSLADFIVGRRDYAVDANGIATIHVNDVLGRGLARIDQIFGMTDYNSLIAEFNDAARDGAVRGILLDVGSPGGSVVGMEEAAAAVANAAAAKPVVAMIEQIGASAAYALSVQATAIVASASAIVGSIGTISSFTNIAGMLERFGVKVEQFTSGDLKASGTPYRAMTLPEATFLNERTQSLGADFRAMVSAARPSVQASSMRGQWFSGKQAASLGLVDQVGSKADAMEALLSLVGYSGH